MDGQWGIDEVYQIKATTYDTRNNSDDSQPPKVTMDAPNYWGRPFFQVTRSASRTILSADQIRRTYASLLVLSTGRVFRWRRRSARSHSYLMKSPRC